MLKCSWLCALVKMILLGIRSFLLVKKENSTCELDPSVTGFSLLVLCVCCEREKKGAAACFALHKQHITQHEKREAEQNRRLLQKTSYALRTLGGWHT